MMVLELRVSDDRTSIVVLQRFSVGAEKPVARERKTENTTQLLISRRAFGCLLM